MRSVAGQIIVATLADALGSVTQLAQSRGLINWGSAVGNVIYTIAASDASSFSRSRADTVCTGSSDDDLINDVLASLPSTGGAVMLSEGNFSTSAPILIENDSTGFFGIGTGQRSGATQSGVGTRIIPDSSITGQVVQVQRAADDRPVYGVSLRDFTVDVADMGSAVDGVLFRCNRGDIDHVHVHHATGTGFRVKGYASPQWDTYDTTLNRVQAGDCAADGVLLDDNANDVHLIHPILYNSNYNLRLKGSSAQVTGMHAYDATINNVKFDGGGSRTKIANSKIEGAGQHGINVDSTDGGYSDIQISCNGLNTNGDSAANTYDHIILQGPSGNGISRTEIVGNAFGNKNSVNPTNKCRYGINLNSSSSQSTTIVGNTFGPSPYYLPGSTAQILTAPIRDNSSGSFPAFIEANHGCPTYTSGTATVANGSTSIAVTHGLAFTPTVKSISVTPTNNKGTATEHWITAPGATTFTINTDVDPGATTATFAWQAHVNGQ